MRYSLLILATFLFASCKKPEFNMTRIQEFPDPVDTRTVPIILQEKKSWNFKEVSFSNQFSGARLNGVEQVNDSTYHIKIEPENSPINPSPWYAFKAWSSTAKNVYVTFDYGSVKHRYHPKISSDAKQWEESTTQFDTKTSTLKLSMLQDTVYVSAQELFNVRELKDWIEGLGEVEVKSIGSSPLGFPIPLLDLNPESKAKDVIVLMSRQHPPEVTGQFAFNAFVERLLELKQKESVFFEKYRILLFPMVNPDGVEQGHWRHNTGGIDLNRDWDVYNQPETKLLAEYLIDFTQTQKKRIVLGIDFHSTWEDIYYTNLTDSKSHLPNFTGNWLKRIKEEIPGYDPKVAPSNIGKPVTKGWFYVQFGAVGITYEIGDDTDRNFIKEKSKIAADAMVEILR